MFSWQWIKKVDPKEVALWLLIAVFSFAYLLLGWQNYIRFDTGLDLGGYTQAFFNLSHGRLPFNTFKNMVMWGDHAHFILTIFTPLYWLFPDARTILAIQALSVTTAAWPLYRISQKITGSWVFSFGIVYAFLAFIGIQYALDFDFHPSVLTGVALVWMMYGIVCEKPIVYWIVFALGLTTREDAAPIFFMVGLYLLFRKKWLFGGLTMALSAAYFLLVAYVVMPLWTPENQVLTYLDNNEDKDVWNVIRGFFFYPDAILQNMFDSEVKIRTMYVLFASFTLLPLLSGFTFLGAAPILYSRFNSGQEYRWVIENHSNANILPILAIGAIFAVGNIRYVMKRLKFERYEQAVMIALGLALVLAVHATAWTDPKIPLRRVFSDTFIEKSASVETRYNALEEVKKRIQGDESVSANSGLLAHLGNRRGLYNYPEMPEDVDWVVLMTEYGDPWPLTHAQVKREIQVMKKDPRFELVWDTNNIFAFHRIPSS